MEKLHSYQGWGGRVHEWRDQIRERYANWREQHPETVIELIKKGARPSQSGDEYSHIYRSILNSEWIHFYDIFIQIVVVSSVSANNVDSRRFEEKGKQLEIIRNFKASSMATFIDLTSILLTSRLVVGQRLAWSWWKYRRPWWELNFRTLLKLHSYRRHCWALAYSINTWP